MEIANKNLSSLATKDDPTIRLFWIGVVVHVILWTLVCVLTQPNLPLDMVEMIFWGEQWQLGYHKHPPLPAWVAAFLWKIGNHSPWLMYLASQMTIAVTFWAVWKLAREGLSPWLALCSVAVLQGCYYCTFAINDINNTIMTRPMWALSILFLYRAISSKNSSRQTLNWCLAGITIALGMLCKYYIAILVLSMLTVPLLIRPTRKLLRTPGPWLMTAIALLVFSPHLIWMVNNDFTTVQYALNRSTETTIVSWTRHLYSPARFVLSQMGAWLPIVLLSWPLIGKAIKAHRAKPVSSEQNTTNQAPFFRAYLSIVVLGPILTYVGIALITGATIRSMWGGPLFSFVGVLLISMYCHAQTNSSSKTVERVEVQKTLRGCLVAATIMLFALTFRNAVMPSIRGDFSRVHFPGKVVSEEIQRRWAEHEEGPLSIVGGDMFVAGCSSIYSPQKIDVFAGMKPETSPWVSDELVKQRGAILVWNINDTAEAPPLDWLVRFQNAIVLEPFKCSAAGAAKGLESSVGMIFVPPQDSPLAKTANSATRDSQQR